MSTMPFDSYAAGYSTEVEPAWARAERLEYCEQTARKHTAGSLFASLRHMIACFFL